MTGKLIHLPARYPADHDGVSIFRRDGEWWLHHRRGARSYELALTEEELRYLHQSAALIVDNLL